VISFNGVCPAHDDPVVNLVKPLKVIHDGLLCLLDDSASHRYCPAPDAVAGAGSIL